MPRRAACERPGEASRGSGRGRVEAARRAAAQDHVVEAAPRAAARRPAARPAGTGSPRRRRRPRAAPPSRAGTRAARASTSPARPGRRPDGRLAVAEREEGERELVHAVGADEPRDGGVGEDACAGAARGRRRRRARACAPGSSRRPSRGGGTRARRSASPCARGRRSPRASSPRRPRAGPTCTSAWCSGSNQCTPSGSPSTPRAATYASYGNWPPAEPAARKQ